MLMFNSLTKYKKGSLFSKALNSYALRFIFVTNKVSNSNSVRLIPVD